MDKTQSEQQSAQWQRGTVVSADARRMLWRVERGAFGILADTLDHRANLQAIALAGDLIGVELLTGEPPPASLFALTDGSLARQSCANPAEEILLLREAHAQSRRQSRELLQLRVGLLHERIALLLQLLRRDRGDASTPNPGMPLLRHLSMILDAAQETICRAMAQRHQDHVAGRTSRSQIRTTRGRRRGLKFEAPVP